MDFTSRVIDACLFKKGLKVCQTKDFHFEQIFCKSKQFEQHFRTGGKIGLLVLVVKKKGLKVCQKNFF